MRETKGCEMYTITRTRTSIYLCVALPRCITIMKWAPHPFNKFMKIKDIAVDFKPTTLDICETKSNEVRLFVNSPTGFRVYSDFQSLAVEELGTHGLSPEQLGSPVKGVLLGESFAACFTGTGLIQTLDASHDMRAVLTWRNALTFAARLGDDYLVVGSASVVDVINSLTGKIVHVFETKKDKIRSLRLLVARGGRLYLLAEEEKDGNRTSAIILIDLC
ncbi:hypothetical protein BC831DRAFT_399103 [Entophlyctis helioformis]|nr:hypothetical protein BC831DRAFT_399103 [Entophlyctis helioformis]